MDLINKIKESRAPITYILLFLNIAMFIYSMTKSDFNTRINSEVLVDLGGAFVPLIKRGEYFRLLTAAFLHADLMHIAFNMYALYAFGPQVERLFGTFKFLIIYILSALGGSILSYVLSKNEYGLSIGASGAIFGLMGAMIVIAFLLKNKIGTSYLTNLLVVAFVNLSMGFAPSSNIDNYGHIGGLVTGIVLAILLKSSGRI